MTHERHFEARRRAYSLVEMLIVVTIMIMLVAVALPVAKKVMDGSQAREASRQLHAYFTMAKARAVQTGRPCGIEFACVAPLGDTTGVRQVSQLYLSEVPAAYAGGTLTTVGKITSNSGTYEFLPFDSASASAVSTSEQSILAGLIDNGELFFVRFNYKGEWYRCMRGISTNTTYSDVKKFYFITTPSPSTYPPGYNDTTVSGAGAKPFQIWRSPKRFGNPLTLSGATCVDMNYSGMGPTGSDFTQSANTNNRNVTSLQVLFSPEGLIDNYYVLTSSAGSKAASQFYATGDLFFLVGRIEKVSNPTPTAGFTTADSNAVDPANIWVTVSRGGRVTTAENVPDATQTASLALYLKAARKAAIYGEQIGGR